MTERMVLPIEWKAEGSDAGTLVGYLSTWDLDLGGDRIVKGAFTKAVQAIKKNGIPLLADHHALTAAVLGTIYDAAQDVKGLKIWARFSSAPSAQDVRIKLVEGHLSKMSIGYEAMDYAFEDGPAGDRVRLLKDVKLYEGSVVVFPMNPEAAITAAKSWLGALPDDTQRAVRQALTAPESKATANELRDQLSILLREQYQVDKTYVWIRDLDETTVWFEVEGPDDNGIFAQGYTLTDDVAALDGDRTEVRMSITYTPISGDKATTLERGAKELPPEGGATGDEPGANAGDEPAESKSTAAGDEPAGAPDEGAAGWDRWASEALLAERPVSTADPAEVAGLRTRLRYAEAYGKE